MEDPTTPPPHLDAALATVQVVNDLAHDRAHLCCGYSDYSAWEGWGSNMRDLTRMAIEHLRRDHGLGAVA
jgi:hypothetical protein